MRPGSTVARVPAASRFAADGRARLLRAYDAGAAAPPRPVGGPGADLLTASIPRVIEAAADRLDAVLPTDRKSRHRALRCTERTLGWLEGFAGSTWEERWLASGADLAPRTWAEELVTAGWVRRRHIAASALSHLLLLRVLRPSYAFVLGTKFLTLFSTFPAVNDPADFARLRTLDAYRSAGPRLQLDAETCLSRVMIRTGKPLLQLTGDDLLTHADLVRASGRHRREHLAWELTVALGPFADEPPTLRAVWTAKANSRQHSAAGVVDRYGIPPSPVRDLLVDYLTEVRPSMDYSTWEQVANYVTRLFWWNVLQVNPAQADLRLSPAVTSAWRERFEVTMQGGPRKDLHGPLFTIRAFYRDIQQWALEQPTRRGVWAAPCPVRDTDLRHSARVRRRMQARMQQRTRTLTPLLPDLLAPATTRRDRYAALLAAATQAADGTQFTADGITYRRHNPPPRGRRNVRTRIWVQNLDGVFIDTSAGEADAFWAWALIETLRHTGCRIEEVLELTQLSLRHYTPPTTGTLVPLLHIAPSKLDAERLIPMNPELVTVLLAVQRRARGHDELKN